MKKILILTVSMAFIILSKEMKAQDPHLSQWRQSTVLLNPAETGHILKGEMRIIANYRSQWSNFGGSISTTAISFDMRKNMDKFSYGGYLLNNNLANIFNNTSFVGSFGYEITEPTNKEYHIKTGIQLGLMYKRFDQNNLTFDNQYHNGNFDPDLPSGEQFVVQSKLMPETSLGALYYNTKYEKSFKPYAGFSVAHLSRPKENYTEGVITALPTKWSFYAGGEYELDREKTLIPYALYMMQGSATELFAGLAFNYTFKNDVVASLDLGYRNKDAVIIQTGFKIKDNWYRIGYDINTSPMKDFIRGSNAIEFSMLFSPSGRFF